MREAAHNGWRQFHKIEDKAGELAAERGRSWSAKEGSLMGTALACKHLLGIGYSLFLVSVLTAQPIIPQPGGPGSDQVPRIGNIPPPVLNEEQMKQLLINPKVIEQLRPFPDVQRKRVTSEEWMHWRWILYGLIALGGLGGGWGAKQALTKKPSLADSPPRVEPMGLGADGTGGVWLREVRPWEK
jgi:hypothetical protein